MRLFVFGLVLVWVLSAQPLLADEDASRWLPDCAGVAQMKPSTVTFACGDGNLYVRGITWARWNAPTAFGDGTLVENDCTPDCASGHFHSYSATVTAFGRQVCPGGKMAYASVAFVVTDARWSRAQARTGDTDLPCGPRR